MRNEKASHIFEHADFIYVLDFIKMTCWVINIEDREDPIATLKIQHRGPNEWWYQDAFSIENAWVRDQDPAWCAKAEAGYAQYINKIIVGNRKRVRKAAPAVVLS